MNGPDVEQRGNQFPIFPQQPPLPAPPRRGIDKTTWFGISVGILVVFGLGAATGSAVSAQAKPKSTPAVAVTAKPTTVEVTPASCIEALDKSNACILLSPALSSNLKESIEDALRAIVDGDSKAEDAALGDMRDAQNGMQALLAPVATATKECTSKAK
ncbi:hypothetical protein [Arthrobacter sp. LAR12-1-1.1]|uniref:hypothetical protein n=1 Tax=Arthrobacter sp. LAR12-1-1.1 TaxID=3135215 RepID=UPI003449DC4A